jgi:hypothetical protein
MNSFIVKHAVPIVENRIKEIILKEAYDNKLDAYAVTAMLKMDGDGNLVIHTFAEGKKIRVLPFSALGGQIFGGVEDFIKEMFRRESKVFNVECAFVNYLFQIDKSLNKPVINVGIRADWKGWTRVETILCAEEIK